MKVKNVKITSHMEHGRLFWRAFDRNDTVYMVGLREGSSVDGEMKDPSDARVASHYGGQHRGSASRVSRAEREATP